jgi:quercetin dioxygenase-like cupin family protein
MESQIVEDPVFRHRLRFTYGTEPDGQAAVYVEMWIEPGGGVPPHVHPAMTERFSVLDGRAEFLAGRSWTGAGPGETVVVPAGTRHAYRNRGVVVAHVRCVATPPDPALEGFLTDAAAMARAGRLTKQGVPKGVTGMLQAAVMLDAYGAMVELGFPPAPPPAIRRLLVPPLARLAGRRGIRAGHFAEAATT